MKRMRMKLLHGCYFNPGNQFCDRRITSSRNSVSLRRTLEMTALYQLSLGNQKITKYGTRTLQLFKGGTALGTGRDKLEERAGI
ncbi:hypothetical protein SOVF_006570 [Spinacia oleracea]|nr:hypothetical protein SOVF_006570 [Spinacia oleracea]